MTDTAARVEPFPSLLALRQAHLELLQRSRAAAVAGLLPDIDRLLQRGSATGAVLDDERQRWEAQGVLDYWQAVMYRARQAPTVETLQPFDPDLAPEIPESRCPYRGLEAFREAQHRLFFGRDRVVSEMLSRMATRRLLIILGPSGSGKSSLVLAGLIPALKAGKLAVSAGTPPSDTWRYLPPMVPGTHPLDALAALVGADAAATAPGAAPALDPSAFVRALDVHGAPVAVVVDQFEEVFTLCADDAERRRFIECLLAASASAGPRHRVVLTMRSDFDAQVAAIPALQAVFEAAQYRIPAFNASELRDAIERPAEIVGLKFEDGIVDRLVREILGEPAGLPLLQFALLKLWERRDRNRVTLETYQAVRGPLQALERSAEELYARLLPEEQTTARRILLRIVRPGSSLEVTSNRVPRESVHGGEPRERVDRVLDKLIAAGLLRQTGGPEAATVQIEVAHEALLRNWPRLIEWLEDERVRLRRRFSLTAAAQQWAAHGKDPGGLLGGSLLEEAQLYDDLDPIERAFVAESVAAADRAARQRERQVRVLVVLLVLLVALASGLGLAVWRLRVALHSQRAEAASKDRALADAQAQLSARLAAAEAASRALSTAETAVDAAARAVQSGAPAGDERKLESAKELIVETKRSIGGGRVDPGVPSTGAPPPAGAAAPPPTAPDTTPAAPPAGSGAAAAAPARSLLDGIEIRASATETGRRVENTTLPLYNFRIWVDGRPEAMRRIARVQYEFDHPTFRQRVQESSDRERRFERGYAGWGCLAAVKVTVFAADARVPAETVTFDMCAAVQYQYRK
jgi:hypothetical protein